MDRLPKILFLLIATAGIWGYGVVSHQFGLFPYPQLYALFTEARAGMGLVTDSIGATRPWWYQDLQGEDRTAVIHDADGIAPGLTLIAGMDADNELMARVIDANGEKIHEWSIDWFEQWPDQSHLAENIRPKAKPGAQLHGLVFTDEGELVFNFSRFGMARMDACSNVEWRLPERTHHSLHWDPARKSYWTSNLRMGAPSTTRHPNLAKGFWDYTVMEVSADGEVRRELSLVDLLADNGLAGLLYLSNIDNRQTRVTGDTLHVNDVEVFPEHLEPGVFEPGDVMVSIRNINGIIVFDPETLEIKFQSLGTVLRQHDPDFIDGNTISVFDNNNLRPASKNVHSRIVTIDASDGSIKTVFAGTPGEPFFTDIMGKHQWLANGNVLITESVPGRAFEISPDGDVQWEYFNLVQPGTVGLLSEALRLPERFDAAWFEQRRRECKADSST